MDAVDRKMLHHVAGLTGDEISQDNTYTLQDTFGPNFPLTNKFFIVDGVKLSCELLHHYYII